MTVSCSISLVYSSFSCDGSSFVCGQRQTDRQTDRGANLVGILEEKQTVSSKQAVCLTLCWGNKSDDDVGSMR